MSPVTSAGRSDGAKPAQTKSGNRKAARGGKLKGRSLSRRRPLHNERKYRRRVCRTNHESLSGCPFSERIPNHQSPVTNIVATGFTPGDPSPITNPRSDWVYPRRSGFHQSRITDRPLAKPRSRTPSSPRKLRRIANLPAFPSPRPPRSLR